MSELSDLSREALNPVDPDLYNGALRALNVTAVTVTAEDDGGVLAVCGDSAVGELVNAVAAAHIWLAAAQSHAKNLLAVRAVLDNLAGTAAATHLRDEIVEALESLTCTISALERVPTVVRRSTTGLWDTSRD